MEIVAFNPKNSIRCIGLNLDYFLMFFFASQRKRGGPGCLNRISASISRASAGVGYQAEGQRREVGFIGCRAVKARMWSPAVVEVQVAADRSAWLADAVVGVQIHLLIFDAAPKPLDEDIIPPGPFAVHADCNVVVGEHTGEGRARELRALICVEDLRLAVTSQTDLQQLRRGYGL